LLFGVLVWIAYAKHTVTTRGYHVQPIAAAQPRAAPPPQMHQPLPPPDRPRSCHNCGEYTHLQASCPYLRNGRGRGLAPAGAPPGPLPYRAGPGQPLHPRQQARADLRPAAAPGADVAQLVQQLQNVLQNFAAPPAAPRPAPAAPQPPAAANVMGVGDGDFQLPPENRVLHPDAPACVAMLHAVEQNGGELIGGQEEQLVEQFYYEEEVPPNDDEPMEPWT